MLALGWLLVACAPGEGTTPGEESGLQDGPPTWHADVAPLLGRRCSTCHREGAVGFPLARYEEAAPRARAIARAVEARTMPPWLARAEPGCSPPWSFVGDPSLSDEEITLLRAWADAGAPLGDAARAVPPQVLTPDHVDGDEIVDAPTGAQVGPLGALLCAALPVSVLQDRWLLAAELEPVDPSSHHGNVLVQPPGRVAPPGWWDCAGEAGRARPLVFWAPGTGPFRAPAGSAIPVRAGESLVVQMHWAPDAGEVLPPRIHLDWADGPPARVAELRLAGNARDASQGLQPDPTDIGAPAFRVPAGAPEHTETMIIPVGGQGPVRLFAVGHHMHRFGWRMTSRVVGGDCLLNTPAWDYDWHTLYPIGLPAERWPLLRPEDQLELACTYRNTADHPGAAQTWQEAGVVEPVDVVLGTDTLDEMCNVLLGVVWEGSE